MIEDLNATSDLNSTLALVPKVQHKVVSHSPTHPDVDTWARYL